ncbi:MAG: Cell division ATP-binding protein FtsE [Candidatus Dichloromethanomonas elyunquensis]|nr:MAG: Cell division ATP-binding protein FtsE [Candidatus Dichloromethanomonas elyunquensis]
MIKLRNVSKIYPNGARALSNISLEIAKGEFVFLVGQSGAGKSTLIKLLYREEVATRGQVYINNANLIRLKPHQVPLVRRNIGVIFQDFKLLPTKTVFENVAFAQHVIGKNKKESKASTENMLELVGLGRKKNAFPSELSGGEQQRVCVARALVNHPSLLVADEPTGNLDMETAWGIMELLNHINKLGTTVVMATHAMQIVKQMNKRVVRVEEGKIAEDTAEGAYKFGF